MEGEADIPIESDVFHIEWRNTGKNLSAPEVQRLNGTAAAAGEELPKRLILITGGGLTRPAAEIRGQGQGVRLPPGPDDGQADPLNSRALDASLPADVPGTRVLEPW